MASRFTELAIDCHDPQLLGEFWSQVLGYDVVETSTEGEDQYVQLKGPPGSGPTLLLGRVPDEKQTKNRLHLDLNATDRDQQDEVERIIALGAKRVDIGQGDDVTWVVLADPEGNEFCVLRSRVEPH